jgi:hypothetical protein
MYLSPKADRLALPVRSPQAQRSLSAQAANAKLRNLIHIVAGRFINFSNDLPLCKGNRQGFLHQSMRFIDPGQAFATNSLQSALKLDSAWIKGFDRSSFRRCQM